MRLRFLPTSIIATVITALVQVPETRAQQGDVLTDPDAYTIYAALVPPAWATISQGVLVLQLETEVRVPSCRTAQPSDPEWEAVENNFKQENTRTWLLQPALPIDSPYRLIPRSEIQADDARLALKYPGMWQSRPESLEYAAVSAVGFNPARTKAMVYVRLRLSGAVHAMEKRDGKWVNAKRDVCAWIV